MIHMRIQSDDDDVVTYITHFIIYQTNKHTCMYAMLCYTGGRTCMFMYTYYAIYTSNHLT